MRIHNTVRLFSKDELRSYDYWKNPWQKINDQIKTKWIIWFWVALCLEVSSFMVEVSGGEPDTWQCLICGKVQELQVLKGLCHRMNIFLTHPSTFCKMRKWFLIFFACLVHTVSAWFFENIYRPVLILKIFLKARIRFLLPAIPCSQW
jgi:hypothetical protein